VVGKDSAQPTTEEIEAALKESRKYWFKLASWAYAQRDNGLAPDDIDPRQALRRVPKFQARPKKLQDRPFGASPVLSLCLETSCTWKVSANADCSALEREVSRFAMLQLGAGDSVPFKLNGEVFQSWTGTIEEGGHGANYLGVLTLGWCYILSARLVELRGEGAFMRYTKVKAECNSDPRLDRPSAHLLDIGEVDEDVARWWSALLAPGEGWEAFVTRDPADFVAPWSIIRTCETTFFIKHKTLSPDSNSGPLSSKKAFEVLAEFALSHQLGSQFSIALATALTIPLHRYYTLTARLPFPKPMCGKKSSHSVEAMPPMWLRLMEELPYYMTLSCNPELMMSILCGSFWEPGVPCNLVSPWLHPVLNEVLGGLPIKSGHDQEVLGLMCAIRRPSIIISGLGPTILEMVKMGMPPLDHNGFAWTGCPQSFMDISGSGPYTSETPSFIMRQDVWRLLHLPTIENDDLNFRHRPFAPWAPCGKSPTKNSALRVMSHLECPRHEYQYDYWNWELEDGAVIKDYGFSRDLSTSQPKSLCALPSVEASTSFKEMDFDVDQKASQNASWDIFHWLFVNGEGVPPEEIYHDDWIKGAWDDESDSEVDEPDDRNLQGSDNKFQHRVPPWLNTALTEFWSNQNQNFVTAIVTAKFNMVVARAADWPYKHEDRLPGTRRIQDVSINQTCSVSV
ncbi:uncharacterized protein N7459_001054, partial [Penicillium hispanicum]|uniref:uncharacterized protein n=1 Tax=Penicillium hispanicum TaxID=1080232 RepID=UPI002541B428